MNHQTRPAADLVIENASELLTCAMGADDLVGRIPGGTVAIAGERILAAGTGSYVAEAVDRSQSRVINAAGRVVLPGFVDCHTHLVFGGSRVDEYAVRLTGGDLTGLAERGLPVGIVGTVDQTRDLGVDGLVESSLPRLDEMLHMGTTTAESKSGYGLTTASELRMLEVNHRLDGLQPVDVVSTFLGAHAFPPGVEADRYVDVVVDEMIPRVAEAKLAAFCDVYCEDGFFTVEQSRRVLEAGIAHGLRPKIHLDQYAHTGAARIAADVRCASADHLNFTGAAERRLLADAGVVGVAMPGLDFAVAHPRPVDIRALIDDGMTVALATDLCPGCWLTSMQFVINLACRSHHLSVAEAVRASTLGPAAALGLVGEIGSLEPGKLADIVILDIDRYEDLAYRLGRNAVETVIKRGKVVVERA
ncbi:MAG TPA: imidazolonepropionase [Thermomicrobiales bacterium]|nr:imidazolonepropionase [Thermomicrobiales bacterium]